MAGQIIKNCCKHCVEQGINCLGCAIAAGVADKFENFCGECVKSGECVIEFKNMRDRNVCWVLGDEDREIYRKQNPDYDTKLKEQEKKAEEVQVDNITEDDIARMERLIALKKKKLAEKKEDKQ